MSPSRKSDEFPEDEVINVMLSRKDYLVLRDIIEKQQSLTWLSRYVRNVMFVFAGGILTFMAFGSQILTGVKAVLGIH